MQLFCLFITLLCPFSLFAVPISPHPLNPRYFIYNNQPTVLISSAEHYGAVVNDLFDYHTYIDTMAEEGMTLTRLWGGPAVGPPNGNNLQNDTLAPPLNHFLPPWGRSSQCCYIGGGNKFDLTVWNPDYFNRLKDYVTYAQSKNIIIEFNFFCVYYETDIWHQSPLYNENNINNISSSNLDYHNVWDMTNSALQNVMDTYVKKIISELSTFDNIYYETVNEPWFEDATMMQAFLDHLIDVISTTDTANPHMIAESVKNPNPAWEIKPNDKASIFNFHYSDGSDALWAYPYKRISSDDETGFYGNQTNEYRAEAWCFMVCGGAVFDNLDYSFNVQYPDGTAILDEWQADGWIAGGGGPQLRSQLLILQNFFMTNNSNGLGLGGDFMLW